MSLAIVTGAGSGLGQVIAERLAADGHRLAIFDREGQAASDTAGRIAGAKAYAADITDEASIDAALAALDACPTILVNNAGISAAGGLEQPLETFRRILEVNLIGAYTMCRRVVPLMVAAGGGAVVNITSGASIAPAPAVGAYGPSKAALANLTRAFALEFAGRGVRVNAVAPGFIAAGLGAGPAADPALAARRTARVPARRLGSAEDVAGAVAFLVSEDARYIHGHELVVDGGLTIAALANILE